MSVFPIKKLDLEIKIQKFDTKDGSLEIIIPYPKNYPNTEFKIKNESNVIGILEINFNEVKTEDYISLDFFYVYSSKSNVRSKYATKEEIELSKGLGKKMLCYAINLLIDNKIIDAKTTILKLNAGGGYCASEEEVDKILSVFSIEEIDNWIFENIKSSYKHYLSSLSLNQKAKIICKALDNLKLVKYYEEYGLKPDVVDPSELDLTWIPMSGYINDVLKKCDNVSDKDIVNILVGMKRKRGENYDEGEKKKPKKRSRRSRRVKNKFKSKKRRVSKSKFKIKRSKRKKKKEKLKIKN